MTFYVQKNEPLDEGLKRIAREQIGIVIDNLQDANLPDDKKIHSLRARSKKMRALLRLPGPVMGDAFATEDVRFRDAAKRLGELRDDHVQAQTIARFKQDYGLKIEAVSGSLEVDPDILDLSLRQMREALAAVDDWQLNVKSFYDIAPGVASSYAKGRRAWRRALQDPFDEHFHKLRKWAKYLWYQTRILERMNRKALHPQRIRLQVLGEMLGHAHDLAVLEGVLQIHGASEKALLGRAKKQKRRQYMQALKVCQEVFGDSPDQRIADMAVWWATWRGNFDRE